MIVMFYKTEMTISTIWSYRMYIKFNRITDIHWYIGSYGVLYFFLNKKWEKKVNLLFYVCIFIHLLSIKSRNRKCMTKIIHAIHDSCLPNSGYRQCKHYQYWVQYIPDFYWSHWSNAFYGWIFYLFVFLFCFFLVGF